MLEHIRNLVFEGGGVKGIAYVGAMEELQNAGALAEIKRVGGTSAGAINALIFALGYSIDEQRGILKSLDFNNFMDDDWGAARDASRLVNEFGWHKGDFFHDWVSKLIQTKLSNRRATFLDLAQAGKPSLYLCVTNLSTGFSEVLSHEKTPNMSIADAVRMSMSIPLFFAAVRNSRGDVYVDGGVLDNYPVKLFDRAEYIDVPDLPRMSRTTDYYDSINREFLAAHPTSSPYVYNKQTLGFRLDSQSEISMFRDRNEPAHKKIESFFDYAKSLISTIMNAQDSRHLHEDDWHRTIYIDTLGVGTTDFDLSKPKKEALIQSGKDSVTNYLAWFQSPANAPINRP